MKYKYPDNTKLRIALLLEGKTCKEIRGLNKEISKKVGSAIKFGRECLPHVTLVSGMLKNKTDFDEVSSIIQKTIQEEVKEPLNIEFEEYYNSKDGEWFFLKLKENLALKDLIEKTKENIKNYFDISDARQIHVTIAKSPKLANQQNEFKNIPFPTGFAASTICIGLSGENGTLKNTIKKFKI